MLDRLREKGKEWDRPLDLPPIIKEDIYLLLLIMLPVPMLILAVAYSHLYLPAMEHWSSELGWYLLNRFVDFVYLVLEGIDKLVS